ncbi:septal ring lytic transglycosylase RlpA family protein [Adhaeribacter radiodurans]|uniref:LysM peptidoglycan-binding domain-containing protein n=1 Tax=Adhaeribacter radiodurans TaxID=2745197 RepID=A0A7L7L9E4_9BACT|nr:LysM peptidoglycan-binding domain-containing protein [Adhaeribacter radiodurans]QMU29450.1 LysM peptidoglycan-binding domain-containing protein [Adhaeribacter radiodurans]
MMKVLVAALFSLGAVSVCNAGQATPLDTVKVEAPNGNQVIRHQVQAKETIFSVSRKYGVAVSKIKQANPGLTTLLVGQVIFVPMPVVKGNPAKTVNQIKTPVKTEPKGKSVSTKPAGPALFDGQGNQVHKVDSKQTLFSIARQYGISVADLKKWNNLPDDNVHDNQTLIVKPQAVATKAVANSAVMPVSPVKPEEATLTQAPVVVSRPETVPTDNPAVRHDDNIDADAPKVTISRITESGLAELISEGRPGNKYLALHKTAPVGSFITVRNLMNNQAVSVRVIGKLPDIGSNDKVIVKVSKRAYQRLGALDNRFMVEVQYEVADKILSSNQ